MTVHYEADLAPNDQPGLTAYDPGFPIPAPEFKGTDTDLGENLDPSNYVRYVDIDYEVGGEPGATNRNAYLLGGLDMPDMHDFRGDHAPIPKLLPGAYGDVSDADDYTNQYAQSIAANAWPDISTEESWDEMSRGF